MKMIFPMEFKPLSEVLKYLGYRIEANNYKKVDWIWLLQKVEGHIQHWTHKWLSLGGQFTLVKYVFESIPMY